jgi:glycine C-acetyltransferase/8-amino-7-oxononanoate synthase
LRAPAPDFVIRRLDAVRQAGLYRNPPLVETEDGVRGRVAGREALLFCGNDYLGLRCDRRVRAAAAAAADRWGAGSGSSRLIAGSLPVHRDLEEAAAAWLGSEAALVLSSGYQANIAVLQGISARGDLLLSDALNHASLIDGCRLARAEARVIGHRDVAGFDRELSSAPATADSQRFVLIEGLYSMDGDRGPLQQLADGVRRASAAGRAAWLVVDEAHALGVLGPAGRGAAAEAGVEHSGDGVLLRIGTFGKALGAHGAFVACDATTRELLVNAARTYIFSTALAPAAAGAAREGIRIASGDGGDELRHRLRRNARRLREGLRGLGLAVAGDDDAPIVPWLIGESAAAMAACRALLERGVYAMAIRPPTVPAGTCRIRFTVSAAHSEGDVDSVLRAVSEAARAAAAAVPSPRPAPKP